MATKTKITSMASTGCCAPDFSSLPRVPQDTGKRATECISPDTQSPSSPSDPLPDNTMAAMAKALGHPARVHILRVLADRQACITGELVAEMPLAQSTISEHLRILREAGLIQGEIEGPRTSYCINRAGLAALKEAVASL
ncbi:MAG: ArsR/SmtB family transcription factor [Acidimicrobiales bacterium]